MKTKTTTSRKEQTAAAAKSAPDTTTDNTASELERKYPTGVTAEQRKERAGRFAALAEKIVAKMNGHDRALLDAAAETVETTAAALVAWQLTEERGLGKRRDDEAMYHRWNDDTYEAQSTLRRNNHEREVAGSTAAVFGMFGSAGLTDAEQVEVVRRFFRNGDHSLAEAEGRAIKAALAMPSPEEIEAAARIVGLTANQFIADALHTAINSAKDLNGGELDLTADERAALDAMNAR